MSTTRRTIRIPDELWQAALAVATARGETLSDVIRDRLAGYLKEETPMSEPVKVTETVIAPDGTITATIELTKAQSAFMDRSMLNAYSIREPAS